MELRPYQQKAVDSIFKSWGEFDKTLLVLPTGCHAKGSQILLFDGRHGVTKNVENIKIGDKLMGPDSKPREVLFLHNGVDEMFKITPIKGEPFIVNGEHILHLRKTGTKVEPSYPDYVDISVRNYLKSTKTFKHLYKLERVGVEFKWQDSAYLTIDPYILGVCIGDGNLNRDNISVCTPDKEIVKSLYEYAEEIGSDIRKSEEPSLANSYFFKGKRTGYDNEFLRNQIRKFSLSVKSGEKFIPWEYLIARRSDRQKLLAGLLDTDGYYNNGGYEYCTKSWVLATDVIFIARSLGLCATHSVKEVNSEKYYRINICGDCFDLPLRVERKKASARQQKKNVLLCGFDVEYVGKGEYFGFTVDRDNLYLDGQFIVHHNCGKTVCFAKVAERALKDGGKALVLAHREELLTQARDKIAAVTGLSCAFEKAGESAIDSLYPITCASVQTLMRESRLRRFSPDHYGTIIVDEAHHALSDSYQNILRYFSSAKVLGVTATPDRGDKQNLGKYFEDIAYEYSIRDAIKEGYLSKILVQTIPLKISLKGVKTTAGDYSADDLGSAIDPYLEEIAKHIPRERKTLIFLPLIATSQRMAQILKSLGHKAEHISGESGERKEILERFHSGECTVLCNSMLLTEGYDEPSVDCVVCLRPTKIRSLYAQIIGRGTRTCEGKDNLLVLDFLWQSEQHNLCHPANLIANKPDVAEQMTKIAEGGKLFDLGELEQEAECTARQEREKSLADAIKANSLKKSRLIDPIEYALFTHDDELQSYSPTFKWEREAPTQKQLQALERLQFNPKAIQSRGFASLLLGNAINRRSRNLATPKQIKILNRFGYKNAESFGFDFATKLITDLANNGWRRKQWKEI